MDKKAGEHDWMQNCADLQVLNTHEAALIYNGPCSYSGAHEAISCATFRTRINGETDPPTAVAWWLGEIGTFKVRLPLPQK